MMIQRLVLELTQLRKSFYDICDEQSEECAGVVWFKFGAGAENFGRGRRFVRAVVLNTYMRSGCPCWMSFIPASPIGTRHRRGFSSLSLSPFDTRSRSALHS
jgi:hypothetical protein